MTRRERIEARVERRREWAESRDRKARAGFEKARVIADGIPLGQPILVGHHSEKRHRRDIARIDSGMRQSCESQDMAANHRSKADGLERQLDTSIFSDDENAIEALQARIAEREAERDRMKAVNAAYRKTRGEDHPARLAQLVKAGTITGEEALRIAKFWALCPYHAGTPHPSYDLTNLGGNIRRDKERIKDVQRRAERQAEAEAAGGIVIKVDPGWPEYCSITFAEKPARKIIEALHAASFHWGGGYWSGKTANIPEEVKLEAEA